MAKIMQNGINYTGSLVLVDDQLNEDSDNPIKNSAVTNALNEIQDKIDGMEYATSDDISDMFPISV